MGWKGESRRHSLSRKGIKTSAGKPMRSRGNARFQLPQHIIDIAKQEFEEAKYRSDIVSSAQGVIVGSQTRMDRHFDKTHQNSWRWDADEMYDSFSQTRKALQEEYGDTITLYRFQGNRSNIKNKHTLNWVHSEGMKESFREMFEDYDEERTIIKKEIPIKDIIALNVGGSGRYEEFVVFNHDSEGLVYPSNY